MTRYRTAPKTDGIYQLLKERISNGFYSKEGMLPHETVLAEELDISRKTLRAALSRLAMENLVERVRGQGTFIRSGKPRSRILVIVGNMEDITNSGRYILPGIQAEADKLGFEVETCTEYSLSQTSPAEVLAHLKEKDYRGILSFSSNFHGDEPVLTFLKTSGLPVLLLHAMPGDSAVTGLSVMGTDYPGLIRDALHYLAGLGHKRIAFLTFGEQRIRKAEYFALLKEMGLDGDPALRCALASPREKEIIGRGIENFFSSLEKFPTAVLCFSDLFAIELYQYLHKHGIRIPEDIAVLSIGGQIGCDFLDPPLSAMDFNCMEIGRSAVRNLLEINLDTPLPRPFMVTPHCLIERESTRKRS
ncbi:MAG: LacI family DNA-binding transcriptional regulator [Lentisphaeria bacterium]|nr:LacI family DNA-binding transcriptional regulator [Lentisphaeria bacterium]